jgi:two-component sensor histidine kinase
MIDTSSASGPRGSLPPMVADAQRLGRAVEAGGAAIWEWRIAEEAMHVNTGMAVLLGLEPPLPAFPAGRFFALVHPDDLGLLKVALGEAMNSSGEFVHDFRICKEDNGELRWICSQGRVVERNQNGTAEVMAGVSHDLTERRLKQEASELLNRELSHRIKNLLSIVGSIATMSGEHRPETHEFVTAFQARLNNLAAAHDLLIQAEWGSVTLDGLAERTLTAIGVRDRVDLSASDLVLGSHDMQTVALVLHELGTNAIKYGALSTPDGRVRLRCAIETAQAKDDAPLLVMLWEELDGPIVAPPVAKGFGINLIERLTRRQELVEPVLDWRPDGLRCHIRLRLSRPPRNPALSAADAK